LRRRQCLDFCHVIHPLSCIAVFINKRSVSRNGGVVERDNVAFTQSLHVAYCVFCNQTTRSLARQRWDMGRRSVARFQNRQPRIHVCTAGNNLRCLTRLRCLFAEQASPPPDPPRCRFRRPSLKPPRTCQIPSKKRPRVRQCPL
jgi:hypothetical protein